MGGTVPITTLFDRLAWSIHSPPKVITCVAQDKLIEFLNKLYNFAIVKQNGVPRLGHDSRSRVCERLASEPEEPSQKAVAAAASRLLINLFKCPLKRVETEKADGEDVTATAVGRVHDHGVVDTLRG